MTDASVIIAGGGPVGLTLALELNHHGVDCILLERNPTTTRHPKMDITNGRSMELFRRLGVADLLRAQAVPPDNPYSVIWCDRLSGWKLATFDYPSVNDKRAQLRADNDGKSALEPGMRVSQILLEPVLKKRLEDDCDHVTVMFGWALEGFEQDDDGVSVQIKSTTSGETKTLRADYLAGCDGAGSVARKGLGIPLSTISQPGPNTIHSDEPIEVDGSDPAQIRRLYMIHFTSPEIERINKFGPAWHLQSPLGWSLIAQDDVNTWTIHVPVRPGDDPSTWDPKQVLFEALGCEIECEINVANPWTPRLCLAERYGEGRVWLAGDSTHQVIPTGGYGMNTGIGDATALGWVLAAQINGWGGPRLFEAYDVERRHVGERNRHASFRHANLRMRIRADYSETIHEDSDRGADARAKHGAHIQDLGNLENEAWGIEWGYRYETSPVICYDESPAPDYAWQDYDPSSYPGGRPPNVFLDDGAPLFDHFGREFTLVSFNGTASDSLASAAQDAGLPLKVLAVDHPVAKDLYDRNLVLIRPDQHVAWRGNRAPDSGAAKTIIDTVRGAL